MTRTPSQIVEVTHHGDFYDRRTIELSRPLSASYVTEIAAECSYHYNLTPEKADAMVKALNDEGRFGHGWTWWDVSFWRDDEEPPAEAEAGPLLVAVDALVEAIQSGEWDDLHDLATRVEALRKEES